MEFLYQKFKSIKDFIWKIKDVICNKSLKEAVYKNNVEEVNKLIKNGRYSNIDCKYYSFNGGSPLMIACYFGYYEIVKILIKNGANVNFTDNDNRTPIYNAVIQPSRKCKKKDTLIMIKILEELFENGAIGNRMDSLKRTPLQDAIKEGNSRIVLFLLKRGFLNSDINQKIESGCYKGYSILDLVNDNKYIGNSKTGVCSLKRYLIWFNHKNNYVKEAKERDKDDDDGYDAGASQNGISVCSASGIPGKLAP